MAERKRISPSMRWAVFSRDGFCCRYCGVQAGEDGVNLQIDHVVSIADGGGDAIDNLVTACQKCNGGKGARTVATAPTPAETIKRIKKRTASLVAQAQALAEAVQAQKSLRQWIVNIKCSAYGIESCHMAEREDTIIPRLVREFGADKILEWYQIAAAHRVPQHLAIRYVCGIARRTREREEAGHAEPNPA